MDVAKAKITPDILLVSALPPDRPQSDDDCLQLWNQGKNWKMWKGEVTSVHRIRLIRTCGWSKVGFVYQRESDQSVHCFVLDLTTYRPPTGVVT